MIGYLSTRFLDAGTRNYTQGLNSMTVVSLTEFDPFNHGASTKTIRKVAETTFQEVSAALLSGWGLTGIDSIEEIYEGEEKSSNNHKVRAGSRIYLFKTSHIDRPATQDLVNRCLVYCEEKSIPVSHIIPTRSGGTYHLDTRIYCLYDFIEGAHFDGSQEEIRAVATQFARLHAVLLNIPYLNEIKQVKGEIVRHDREELGKILDTARAGREDSDFSHYANGLIDELGETSRATTDKGVYTLPLQVVHLDLHPHNMIFNPATNELLAFLDFDPMCYSERVRDVGFAMHRVARTYGEKTEGKKDSGVDIRVRAKLFLEAYTNENPLTDEEIRALPIIIQEEALRRIMIILGNHYLSGDETFNFDLEKQITILREGSLFSFWGEVF